MNKIKIVNDKIETVELDDSIFLSFKEKKDNSFVNVVKIIINKDTELDINYDIKERTKLDLFINVKSGVSTTIYEHVLGDKLKIKYRYYLEENSNCEIYKTSHLNEIKENTIINLNGEYSKIKKVIKTISKGKEDYDMMVYHNAKNTISNLINHGVNIKEGILSFNVSSFVPKNNVGCMVDQNNRIINLTQNICVIQPNMCIDCFDVIANHSAFVGTFKGSEMFYLQSRGIPYEETLKLLINGFLVSNLPDIKKDVLKEIISQYWR